MDITLGETATASFNPPYNRIDVRFTPTNGSIEHYEVRITLDSDTWDIGTGQLAYYDTNVAGNAQHSFSIDVNSSNFSRGDGLYRISFYARSAVDGSWDVSYLFFTVGGSGVQFELADGSGFAVLTNKTPPVIGNGGE